jgi:hypothetical protein
MNWSKSIDLNYSSRTLSVNIFSKGVGHLVTTGGVDFAAQCFFHHTLSSLDFEGPLD